MPAQLASSRRLRKPRQNTSWVSRVASFLPIPLSRASVAILAAARAAPQAQSGGAGKASPRRTSASRAASTSADLTRNQGEPLGKPFELTGRAAATPRHRRSSPRQAWSQTPARGRRSKMPCSFNRPPIRLLSAVRSFTRQWRSRSRRRRSFGNARHPDPAQHRRIAPHRPEARAGIRSVLRCFALRFTNRLAVQYNRLLMIQPARQPEPFVTRLGGQPRGPVPPAPDGAQSDPAALRGPQRVQADPPSRRALDPELLRDLIATSVLCSPPAGAAVPSGASQISS